MVDEINSNQDNSPKTVDIKPLTKWKRFLVYLSDLFINLIFAFILFNAACAPIGKAITGYDKKNEEYISCTEKANSVLYENKLVFIAPLLNKDYLNDNIAYTYDCFLSYYVLDTESSLLEDSNPQYGHKQENEIIYHFYKDIRNDEAEYARLFNLYNQKNNYFSQSGGVFVLKDEIKNELKPFFDPKDEMSKSGDEIYKNIKNNIYTSLISEVFENINQNDLTFNSLSYLELTKNAAKIEQYHRNLLIFTGSIAYLLSSIICYIIVPLVSPTRKTLSMMFMRVEKININRLYVARRWEAAIGSLYSIISNAIFMMFIPITLVPINYLFSMSFLLIFSLAGLTFSLVSLFVMIFNAYNRTLSDVLSYSVIITTEDLDAIYASRGYDI